METALSESLLQTKNDILENYLDGSDQSVKDAVSARFDDIEQPLKDIIESFGDSVSFETSEVLRYHLEKVYAIDATREIKKLMRDESKQKGE